MEIALLDPFIRSYALVLRGGRGLACDDEGLWLGPVVVAKADIDAAGHWRCRLQSAGDIGEVLRLAYGPISTQVVDRWCRGLAKVTELLARGEAAHARIYAVLLGFPEIPTEGMAKLARTSTLQKYNPDWEDEARVPQRNLGAGQWTGDESDVEVAAAGDLKCQGSCQSGGSYGTTAMFKVFGKNLCWDCAVKTLGMENEPPYEKVRTLERFILPGSN